MVQELVVCLSVFFRYLSQMLEHRGLLQLQLMQIPGIDIHSSHDTVFETILGQLSSSRISIEQGDSEVIYLNNEQEEGMINPQKIQETEHIWSLIDQSLHHYVLQEEEAEEALDLGIEIKRVTSSRQQQETKIFQFLLQNQNGKLKWGSLKEVPSLQVRKASKSVSPKKTKKIDKLREFRLHIEQD